MRILMKKSYRWQRDISGLKGSDSDDISSLEGSDSNEALLMITAKNDQQLPTGNCFITTDGIGKIMIKKKDGIVSYISNVLYVPKMKNSLISLGQLFEKGYNMRMEDRMLKIFNKNKTLILKAPLSTNRTFNIGIQLEDHECLESITNETWTWNKRFGHINFRSLELMSKGGMLWIYLLEKKSEVLNRFKSFKALVEKQYGNQLKLLNFMTFCEKEGITHEIISPYTPQQNETAEMVNRTILNMVMSMMRTKKLPKKFWGGEAVATTTYIANRSPTKRLKGMPPEEVWSGLKPSVKHFRVFGPICYRHIPDNKIKKLDDKGEKSNFLGYHSIGAYKLYDPVIDSILYNRGLKFDETKAWEWNSNQEGSHKASQIDIEFIGRTPQEVTRNEGNTVVTERPQRQRPTRSRDYEIFSDTSITYKGDLVHMALLEEMEPIIFEQAIRKEC
ncbi:PREDICTED: uncharacterized protein LOC109340299 [Lupinus angustifolius]|uniref:uncharacterized protein LOC109340299 n=1 Tax=Lupinus angustifolius TaxID=3871 RepID=UPI00092E513B|nr:PREDICTED: uncharacterized protein LOC109340299 [Lupinus angustifolius]